MLGPYLLYLLSAVLSSKAAPPPLRVISVTPASHRIVKDVSAGEEVQISNRQAITVSFNFAYIALGSDFGPGPLPDSLVPVKLEPQVPGRWQWVTTSILRFDPAEDWPAELHLRLALSENALAYDGRQLERGGQTKWRFRTPQLRMWISDVLSDHAKAITDGRWSSRSNGNAGPEVPPDGRVQLSFSSDVDTPLIRQFVHLRQGYQQFPPETLEFGQCLHAPRRCIEFRIPRIELETDGQYEIAVDKGAQFHRDAGRTHQPLSAKFTGLHNFSFQFRHFDTTGKREWLRPKFRRQRLWLRHGLQDGVNLEQLAAQFKLSPELHITLTRPEAAVLQLEAAFEPDMEYTLQVHAHPDLKDGFGLPLQASDCKFMTAKLEPLFLTPGSSTYDVEPAMFAMANASNLSWPVLVRGKNQCLDWPDTTACEQPQHMSIVPVLHKDAKEAIASLYDSSHAFMPTTETPVARVKAAPQSDAASVFYMPLAGVLQPSGLAMRTMWTRRDNQGTVHKQSSLLGVPSLVATLAMSPDGVLSVWVLRASDNALVSGADVTVYGTTRRWEAKPMELTQLASQKTDEHGLAHLQSSMFDRMQLSVVVQAPGEPLLIETDVPSPAHAPARLAATGRLITDRAVYKPLDEIKIKGYIKEGSGVDTTLLDANTNLYLRVYWTRKAPVTIPITLDRDFGSFDATMQVPAEAQFGYTTIDLLQERASCDASKDRTCAHPIGIGSCTITVADPRPPTVALKVDAHDGYLKPGGHLKLSLQTNTLTGIPISGANVKLVWKLRRKTVTRPVWASSRMEQQPVEDESGEVDFVTSAGGNVTLPWRPSNMSHQEEVGDDLNLHFSWVGPTRELIQHVLEVPVSRSKWTIDLEVPAAEDTLPGIPFRAAAKIRMHSTLSDPISVSPGLSVRLLETKSHVFAMKDVGPGELPLDLTLIHECTGVSCDLTIPHMGNYSVAACTTGVHSDIPICSMLPVGRSEHDWQTSPLRDFLEPAIRVSTDHSKYYVGDRPKLMFYNPLPKLRAFVKWGDQSLYRHMVTDELDVGHTSIVLPELAQECEHGCSVRLFFCAPSNSSREMLVPASYLFDFRGPMSVQKHLDLVVEARERQEVSIKIETDQEVQEPGSDAGLTISVWNADASPVDGEVCVFGVDKAFLNLQPHLPMNLTDEFSLKPSRSLAALQYSFTHRALASLFGLNISLTHLQRLLHIDPWLVQSHWPLHPGLHQLLEMPLDEVLEQHTSDLTSMPHGSGPRIVSYSARSGGGAVPESAMIAESAMMEDSGEEGHAPAPMMKSRSFLQKEASADDHAEAGSSLKDPSKTRSNFKVTPLFMPAVKVIGGRAHVPWKLPDNTGSFELRAYVVSTDGRFGGGSIAHQVSRRPVSLSPSVPRIARIGDVFKAGATLTNSEKHAMSVDVSIGILGDHMELDDVRRRDTTQHIELKGEETKEVVFSLHAKAIGNASAVLSVSEAGKIIDSLRVDIEIMGLLPEAQVATSFPIPAKPAPSLPWQEGLALPVAANGTGKISFTAGTGRLPAVQNLAATLLKASLGCKRTAYELLGAAATPALLKPYGTPDSQASSELPNITAELGKLTTARSGLHYSDFLMKDAQDHIDLQLNAFALYITRRLRLAGVPLSNSWVEMEASWRKAVSRGLVTYAERAQQESSKFMDYETLVACRLALGTSWQPDRRVQSALSMEVLLGAADSLSASSKAALCLLLVLPADPSQDGIEALKNPRTQYSYQVRQILTYLRSLVRVTARTAYVSEYPGSAHASSLRANGMVLSAFALAGEQSYAHIDKIANYVARGGGNYGSASAAIVAFGLVDYDTATQSSVANVHFNVFTGMSPLFSWHLQSSDLTASAKELPWDKLPAPAPPLLFQAEGTGEVSVAVSLSFVPAEPSDHSIFRGIDVQKVLQQHSQLLGGAHGKPISHAQLGHVMQVTLQITTADDLRGVLVEDWLPAGLEALDPNLDSSRSSRDLNTQCPMWSWWRCTVFKQETKKDRVTFYSPMVTAGTHVLRYQAIAATRGEFLLPPTRAWVVLEPEVMGYSGSSKFAISDEPEQKSPTAMGIMQPSKPCPKECSGRGSCDTSVGRCTCNVGSAGADCSLSVGTPHMMPLLDDEEGDESIVLVNGDKDVVLNVTLLASSDSAEKMVPEYLFVRALQQNGSVVAKVHHSDSGHKQVVVALSQQIAEAFTTDVVVSASADGSFFASRRLSVSLYPTCIPESSRWCRCPQVVDAPARSTGEQDCLLHGTFTPCDCTRRRAPKVLKTDRFSQGGPSGLYGLALAPLVLCMCCYLNRTKRSKRVGDSQREEDKLLYPLSSDMGATDDARSPMDRGQSHGARQLNLSRDQMVSGDYVEASELAE